ncbi:MAG: GNAT family N-acetyltransferase [Ignavibacteriaceae bacterium]|nr:GNAT family N-acetyltransferase [Ignavibacteriaceae bacterium]
MNPFSFAPITSGHIPRLLQMMEEFYKIDGYPFDTALTGKNFRDFLEKEHLGRGWLIMEGTTVIGYLLLCFGFSFEFGGRNAFLDELYIIEEFRGRGAGSLAVDFILKEAPNHGVKALHLEVELTNHRAFSLYKRKGFTEHKRRLMTVRF